MSTCAGMKLGQVYVCRDCGLELKVVKECDCHTETEECSCSAMSCCGDALTLKEE